MPMRIIWLHFCLKAVGGKFFKVILKMKTWKTWNLEGTEGMMQMVAEIRSLFSWLFPALRPLPTSRIFFFLFLLSLGHYWTKRRVKCVEE
jgi:hypothetical protein